MKWRKEAYAGPEWILISERLPERGQVVDLYDAMFNKIDRHTITCDPAKIDGDYVMWRPVSTTPPIPTKAEADGAMAAMQVFLRAERK